jgi:hypothetical protein
MLTIFYNGIPHPTHKDGTNGNVYKTDIWLVEVRHSRTVTILRIFGGSDTKAIGWRMIENGKEVDIPLWIKNKLELK